MNVFDILFVCSILCMYISMRFLRFWTVFVDGTFILVGCSDITRLDRSSLAQQRFEFLNAYLFGAFKLIQTVKCINIL